MSEKSQTLETWKWFQLLYYRVQCAIYDPDSSVYIAPSWSVKRVEYHSVESLDGSAIPVGIDISPDIFETYGTDAYW